MRRPGGEAQLVGVRQPRRRGAQLGVLSGNGCGGCDLGHAVPQHVRLPSQLAGPGRPVRKAVLGRAPRPELRGVRRGVMAPVSIQGGALLGRAGEPELVGLAVHGEQVRSDVAEYGHRYRRSAGEPPGSPASR